MTYPTINNFFLKNARKFQNEIIIKYKKEGGGVYLDLSWKELATLVTDFCAGLINLGMKPDDRLAILSFNRLEWIVSDLGTLLCAGVDVPLYHTNTAEQCAYILNDCKARFIVVEDDEQLAKLSDEKYPVPHLEKIILINGISPENDERVISYSDFMKSGKKCKIDMADEIKKRSALPQPDSMATIVYTSGTTGPPKGCMISHKNASMILHSIDEMHNIDPSTNISLLVLPISHFYPRISGYYFNIFKNMPMALAESIEALVDNISEIRPTCFCCVPRILEKVYAKIIKNAEKSSFLKKNIFYWAANVGRKRSQSIREGKKISFISNLKFKIADRLVFKTVKQRLGGRLKFTVCAGAPLLPEIGEFINSLGIEVIEFYGLTESPGGTMTTFGDFRFGTVGKPMPGMEVEIADDGEILIKGNNFLGYYNNLEKTSDILIDGWCHTEDIGEFKDGFLVITDRKKDIIITSGGKNIAPQNLENLIISKINLVSNVMVYGDMKKYLTALLTLDPLEVKEFAQDNNCSCNNYEKLIQQDLIRDHIQSQMDLINSQLARYETIKKFVILDREFSMEKGEITPTLKLKRKNVKAKFKDLMEALY